MNDWKECTLSDIIIFKNGKKKPDTEGTFPVYGGNGILGYVNDYNLSKGIAIGRVGVYCGSVYYSRKECWISDNAIQAINRDNSDLIYDYYLLKFLRLNERRIGTSQPLLTQEILNRIVINCPDIMQQRKIAAVLSAIDNKIELNTAINENLEQQAQALYRQMFVNADDNQSATIADISLNVTDGVHNTVKDDSDGSYLLLSCKNIKGGSLNIGSSERHINKETFDKLRKRTQLAKGDILISSVGTIGEILMLNTEPTYYEFQRSVAMIKPDTELVSPAYVYESLLYKKAELINAAHGAVQQCLFISDISEFPIDIPSKVKLDIFNSAVIPMFEIITANNEENQRLAALRDTLLPKLMNGEIDVSAVQI